MSRISSSIKKLKTFFNTKVIDQTWEIKYKILTMISGGLIMVWYCGMTMQLIDTFGSGEYSMFLDYGMITLTLFGFTLIGGIFEDDQEQPLIKLKLFDSSINFLITSIAFFVMYSLSYFLPKKMDFLGEKVIVGSFSIALLVGFIGLILGFVELLKILIDYRIKLKNNAEDKTKVDG